MASSVMLKKDTPLALVSAGVELMMGFAAVECQDTHGLHSSRVFLPRGQSCQTL